jgi:hypothetical protein
MHQLTKSGNWEVMFRVKWASGTYTGRWGYTIYSGFKIDSEANEFRLQYCGERRTRNTLSSSPLEKESLLNQPFRTYDRNTHTCVQDTGAWWQSPTPGSCHYICLNCKNAVTGTGGHTIWDDQGCKQVSETFMGIRRIGKL